MRSVWRRLFQVGRNKKAKGSIRIDERKEARKAGPVEKPQFVKRYILKARFEDSECLVAGIVVARLVESNCFYAVFIARMSRNEYLRELNRQCLEIGLVCGLGVCRGAPVKIL